jgi:hypothetical protein
MIAPNVEKILDVLQEHRGSRRVLTGTPARRVPKVQHATIISIVSDFLLPRQELKALRNHEAGFVLVRGL